jgi:hypothetical protein
MDFQTFYQIHRVYLENVKFSDVSNAYNIALNLVPNTPITINGAVIALLSQSSCEIIYESLLSKPLIETYGAAIKNFQYLIDSIIGEDTFHPMASFSDMRYIHYLPITEEQKSQLLPFCKVIDYGPYVLLQRRSKVQVHRRSLCSN